MRRRTFLGLPMTYVAFIAPAVADDCIVVLLDHADVLPLVNEAPYPITSLTTNYAIDTAVKKFGVGSLQSTGVVGQQTAVYTAEPGGGITFTNGDVTVEFQFRRSGGSGTVGVDLWHYYMFLEFDSGGWLEFDIWSYTSFSRGSHQGLHVELDDGGSNYDELYADDFPLGDSDFHACAVTIEDDVARIFMDGVELASATLGASAQGQILTRIYYGDVVSGERVDETRVMLNRAQYTGAYTPATGPWTDATCDSGVDVGVFTLYFGETTVPLGGVNGAALTARNSFVTALYSTGAVQDCEGLTFDPGYGPIDPWVQDSVTVTLGDAFFVVDSDFAGRYNTTSGGNQFIETQEPYASHSKVWTLSDPINAFGFYMTDPGEVSPPQVVVKLAKVSDSSVVSYTINHSQGGASGKLVFWGFIDETGESYSQIEFSITSTPSPLEAYAIDDIWLRKA